MKKQIYITQIDHRRLSNLIEQEEMAPYNADRQHLKDLKSELSRATIVEANKIPEDVVTMNSVVSIRDADTEEELEYTLVFPEQADIEEDKISIIAPIGTAILGYKVGDIVEWEVPSGTRRLKIEKVLYQPEAAGDYHL